MGPTPIVKKTYTAAYSARTGKNGIAPAEETPHIVELFANRTNARGGLIWETTGNTLCGIPAERNSSTKSLIAARDADITHVRCKMCSFRLSAVKGNTNTARNIVAQNRMLDRRLSDL